MTRSLTFGEALLALQSGKRVARSGWNGKGMWIALTPGSEIAPEQARVGAAEHVARLSPPVITGADLHCTTGHGGGPCGASDCTLRKIRIGAHIDMKAADGSLVIGWLASQTDMLASDWTILDE